MATTKQAALEAAKENADQFRGDFPEWLEVNFHVFEAFEREANKIRALGRKTYGHRTIWEFLRHQTAIRELRVEWKLNNDYTKSCAKLYCALHPDAGDFFQFRDGVSVADLARAA